jgi:hypothetical protein
MYNICYRSETGQEAILLCCNPKNLLSTISYEHSGDIDVMRQVRRLELALQPDGWRGNVEAQLTKEFYQSHKNYDKDGENSKRDDSSHSTFSQSHLSHK